jgi:hypothetical protein
MRRRRDAFSEADMLILPTTGALAIPAAVLIAPNILRTDASSLRRSAADDNFEDDPPPCAAAAVVKMSREIDEERQEGLLAGAAAARWMRRF